MIHLVEGDCRDVLATLPEKSVQCCVTSPPYYGLRDYGVDGQIGLEPSPDEYVAQMVEVFRGVHRVLREDGTCWLNIGDSYASGGRQTRDPGKSKLHPAFVGEAYKAGLRPRDPGGVKPKDLLGIPWRVAFALQADGWCLRSAIVWAKPNPMPESVTDRPTSAYEHVFLFAKAERYYYDAAAIEEPGTIPAGTRAAKGSNVRGALKDVNGRPPEYWDYTGTRNARNVWTIATRPYAGAHFATMPPDLAERCIKAGSKTGDTVLDPFGGAGTTGLVADRLGRDAILIELNPQYAELARGRIKEDAGMFACLA